MNIPFALCEFGDEEREAVNYVLKGHWLASGPQNEEFEHEFAEYIGTKYAIAVNSGSSANLISLSSLSLPKGTKVLTGACGFPATLSPILHLDFEPILVDYDITSHNVDAIQISDALRINKDIRTVILAHTLGNPLSLIPIINCPFIEDCCEAVGSLYNSIKVGLFGTLGTFSFYPAHQMTAEGTGGMIVTNNEQLAKECRSRRDWGKVWDWDTKLGDNKTVYNSKIDDINYYKHYTYETLGFNAKLSETAAAFGRVQLKKLDNIRQRRIENYNYLYHQLEELGIFYLVKASEYAKPSWFGFPLTLVESGKRESLGNFLEDKGIRTRPFFAGNITRHKPFRHLYQEGSFPVADKLMKDSLFIGIGQWLTEKELDYITESIKEWSTSQSVS